MVLVIARDLRGQSRVCTIITTTDILVEMLKKKSQMVKMEWKEKKEKMKKSLPHALLSQQWSIFNSKPAVLRANSCLKDLMIRLEN